jgi:hypothetical protein
VFPRAARVPLAGLLLAIPAQQATGLLSCARAVLAATGRADELLAAMAASHVTRLDASNPNLLAVFYLDGTSAPTKAGPRSPRPTCPG